MYETFFYIIKKGGQMDNALQLYCRYRVMDLGNRVRHYNECVKFECNDTYQLLLHTKIHSEQK